MINAKRNTPAIDATIAMIAVRERPPLSSSSSVSDPAFGLELERAGADLPRLRYAIGVSTGSSASGPSVLEISGLINEGFASFVPIVLFS